MTSLRALLAASFALATASLGHAGLYLKATGLYSNPSDLNLTSGAAFKASLKNNLGVAGALGYKFSLLRIEAELQHVRYDVEADNVAGTLLAGMTNTFGTVKETSGFANGYVDLPSFLGLAPYLGVGLGYARINLDGLARINTSPRAPGPQPVLQFSGGDNVFGYQGMAGLQFHLFGQATIHAGFRILKKQDLGVREVVANAQRTLSAGTNRIFEVGVAIGF